MKCKKLFSYLVVTVIMISLVAAASVNAATRSKTYVKYTHSTGTTTNYVLTISDQMSTSTREADYPDMPGVIGEDERYRDGNEGIVRLSNGATGFVVSAHVIATAAHCIYDRGNAAWVDYSITLYDEDGIATDTVIEPVETHMPYNFYSDANDRYDYALITVSEDLSDYVYFDLGIAYDIYDSDFSDVNIYVSGFPQMVDNEENGSGSGTGEDARRLYTASGSILQPSEYQSDLLYYDTDISPGTSGGPVYLKTYYGTGTNSTTTSYQNVAISICAGIYNYTTPHFNQGPLIDSQILQFYKNNSNISY